MKENVGEFGAIVIEALGMENYYLGIGGKRSCLCEANARLDDVGALHVRD